MVQNAVCLFYSMSGQGGCCPYLLPTVPRLIESWLCKEHAHVVEKPSALKPRYPSMIPSTAVERESEFSLPRLLVLDVV